MAKFAINANGAMLLPSLVQVSESISGSVVPLAMFYTLACYPDSSKSELETIFCADCLEIGVVCQEDLNDMSLLQK